MDSSNPYAPPQADVRDVVDPSAPLGYADRGTRLAAAILDQIIAAAVMMPFMTAFFVTLATSQPGDEAILSMAAAGATITLIAGAVWCWFTIRYVKRNGQSIGKKLLDIKVVRTDGSPASLARIFWLRNVVNSLLGFVPAYPIVDVLFIFGEGRQCLHDKLADTIVVKA
ncbi:MAG TPA: RDD family protein [Vicinamibacterales bacterium]|nr:RDD family protein [Vicinamibacterales bacterium]